MPPYDSESLTPPGPVARVMVRHPEREASVGDVPMLIDSGADASLLPRAVAAALGLEGTGERYQLMGSTARSAMRSPSSPPWCSCGGVSGADTSSLTRRSG